MTFLRWGWISLLTSSFLWAISTNPVISAAANSKSTIVFRHEKAKSAGPLGGTVEPGSNGDLMVMSPQGRRLHLLTHNPASDYVPAFSPSGREIAFASDRAAGRFQLYSLIVGSHSITRLTFTDTQDYFPAWSPHGRWIVFSRSLSHGYELFKITRQGKHLTRLTRNQVSRGCQFFCGADDLDPSWSPAGDRIVFYSDKKGDHDLYTISPDGKNRRTLLRIPISNEEAPEWSPNGRKVVFASNVTGNYEIYVTDRNGDDLKQLTFDSGFDYAPAWSPSGKRIAFSGDRDGDLEIFTVRSNGSNLRQITHNLVIDTTANWVAQ